MSERAATRAVDLRHAAQAVRVLDLPAVPVRLQDLAVDQEHPDILGHHLLAGVWPHGLNALVEWSDASLQRLEAHCGQQIRHALEQDSLLQHIHAVCGHELSPIDEREPIFRMQPQGFEAVFGKHLHRRAPPVSIPERSQAEKRQRQMGKRRQITGGTDAASTRNARHEPMLLEVEKPFERRHRNAGVPEPQRVNLELEHQQADVARNELPHAHGVTQYEVALKLLEPVGVDSLLREGAETGVDAVVRLILLKSMVDDLTRPPHPRRISSESLEAPGDAFADFSEPDRMLYVHHAHAGCDPESCPDRERADASLAREESASTSSM